MKLLVIADDFTGAMDTGVQFSKNGIATLVSTRTELNLDQIQQNIQVLVVDTESRHLKPDKAYEIVYDLTNRAREYGIQHVYKKTDSTLRGNIGAELKAVMDAWDGMPVMYVPAYPKTGRTTFHSKQFVDGIPLHETIYSKDLLNPIKTCCISEIILKQADVKTVAATIGGKLTVNLEDKDTVYIFDGQVEEDLTNTGNILKARNKLSITAGCAGFAERLSNLIDFEGKSGVEQIKSENILVVCGSINEASMHQIRFGEKHGFESILLTSEQKSNKGYWETFKGKALTEEVVRKIAANGKVIIKTVSDVDEIDVVTSSQKIADSIGELTNQILSYGIACTLVVFGGDTAIHVMDAIECSGLKPLEEIVPGVAVSKAVCKYGEMTLISKAGGFGEKDVLLKIQNYLKGKVDPC
ncbi:MAG TPA: four-carbon acid sugar kinase family protein [Ruminiclostridium sp.]